MKIRSLTLCNFRCFSQEPTEVPLDPALTALVGSNGSGKTALLVALARLFGTGRSERAVVPEDFHVPLAQEAAGRGTTELWIEARLEFPELANGTGRDAIPHAFHHMVIEGPGAAPFCRIRLAAEWSDDGTSEGDVEQHLWWVTDATPDPGEESLTPVKPHERGLIQVQYLPAARGAASELQRAVRQMIERLTRAVLWTPAAREALEAASRQAGDAFAAEGAVDLIQKKLAEHWQVLHDAGTDTTPELHLLSRRFEDMVRRITVSFRPTEQGGTRELQQLSDGQKTLFYLALVTAVFEIERAALDAAAQPTGGDPRPFDTEKLLAPALTVFAIEEPENHLAPFYLSRIVGQLLRLTGGQAAQAVISSHSPAILGRVDPLAVRVCRLDDVTRAGTVRRLTFPEDDEQTAKYVRGAVQAYPELYFARFVILAEGDSEQVVLPRLARALGLEIDPSFVAVVPLGGRHVNHFWRLLEDISIPHATLLDLDMGRAGGDWGRVHEHCRRLLDKGIPREQLLLQGDGSVMSDAQLDAMADCILDSVDTLHAWVMHLEKWGVFFSCPLDLDLAMLAALPDAYKGAATGRPRSTEEQAGETLLGSGGKGPGIYRDEFPDLHSLFPWYRYLFLTNSKPATHLRTLAGVEDPDLAGHMPAVYRRLLEHVERVLNDQHR